MPRGLSGTSAVPSPLEPARPVPPALAIVVPVFDEEDSLRPLFRELDAALACVGGDAEIILVDDGSRDGSARVLRELAEKDPRVEIVRLDAHRGQSAALDAGFRAVTAPVIVTLDADLQNDPADIPKLLAWLDRADVVNGVRVARRDPLAKRAASRIANAVRNRVTGESITDVGCSLRAMRTAYVRRVRLDRGLHRFLPTLLAIEGARVVEVPVSHRPRRFGRSKYGVRNRLFVGIADLLAVRRMKRRAERARRTSRPA